MNLTESEQKIFDRIKEESIRRGTAINETFVRNVIRLANVDGDGKKRVVKMETGETFLVPIDDIILNGLRGQDLDRYGRLEK